MTAIIYNSSMKKRLLKFIVCPKCKSKLSLKIDLKAEGEVKEGSLSCEMCRAKYLITNFIPRFVKSDKQVENFSFEWLIHQTTQLDSVNKDKISKQTFIDKTGFEKKDLNNKLVLDTGCGMGRFMEVALDFGAEVIGVDLSLSVEAARENLKKRKKYHLVQADIFNLPFKLNTFNIAFSIGVLHHTPNTKKAFMKMASLVSRRGKVAIWVYGENTFRPYDYFSRYYRRITPFIPKRILYALSHLAVPLYWTYKIPVLGVLINLIIPYSTDPNGRWRILDTFDWYSPRYQWKHTYPEVADWFKEAGLRVTKILPYEAALQGVKE
jgi:ubiquinone/menaquinone biosynthesis C-methylase UbiE